MALTWPAVKDPDEVKDYLIRFGPLLIGGDTLATIVSCAVVSGTVVIDSSAIVADVPDEDDTTDYGASSAVRIWFSGGTVNTTCETLTRVTTAGGRKYDQTAKLKLKAK
jgi:hypothetical protein